VPARERAASDPARSARPPPRSPLPPLMVTCGWSADGVEAMLLVTPMVGNAVEAPLRLARQGMPCRSCGGQTLWRVKRCGDRRGATQAKNRKRFAKARGGKRKKNRNSHPLVCLTISGWLDRRRAIW
jgi:hypothetical protein